MFLPPALNPATGASTRPANAKLYLLFQLAKRIWLKVGSVAKIAKIAKIANLINRVICGRFLIGCGRCTSAL